MEKLTYVGAKFLLNLKNTGWIGEFCHVKHFICSSPRYIKVKNIQKDSLHLIPSPLVKIQIMGRKVWLRCKGKMLLSHVYKLFIFKSLLTTPSNVLPLHLPPMILFFIEGEGDKIKLFRLPFIIFHSCAQIIGYNNL